MRRRPRILLKVACITLVLGLTGCVWARLLEIKSQLASFDEHVRVQVVDNHFVLNFLRPVLLSEDFTYLTKLNPSRIEKAAKGNKWFLDFEMEPGAVKQPSGKIISFAWTFGTDQKLSAFQFSPLFLQMAPPIFLEASIRSLGAGTVDQGKRQLKVDPDDLPRISAKLPTRRDIVDVMGQPAEQFPYKDQTILVYRFKARANPVEPEYEDRRLAEAKLFFNPATDELVRLAGKFAGLKLSIDYRKFLEARHPSVAGRTGL